MMQTSEERSEPSEPTIKKRRVGLSLRVMLGLMALVAVGLATWANQIRQMRAATALVRQHHGMYYFDFEYENFLTLPDCRSGVSEALQ